jgi:hypothetical protein
MATSVPAARAAHQPISVPLAGGNTFLVATVILALMVYYFLGVDQGAVSIFGNDMHIHEFVHDGRHLLGFPCH